MVPSVARDALPSRGSEFVRAERSPGAVDEQLFESRWRPGSPEGEEPFGDGLLAPTGQADARDSDVEAFAAHASEDDTTPRRRRGPRIIERGPARADAALDAWCSFCCRPRAEVGDLVAGPAGAFICKACLTESASLLGDVSPVPLPARPRSPVRASAAMDFVGQPDVRSSMERALQSGARCILLVGAEGWGKSVLLQMLQRQGRGTLTPVASLAEDLSASPLFVEDVDRLSTEHQTALSVFLARESRPSVVLSARGLAPEPGKLILRGGEERLLVPTTEALSRAVRGVIPVSILEHVQVLLSLHPPTREDYVEMARVRLALREPATSLSDSVLSAFAAEAERSPRAGHELQALLQRVPPGTWELENVTKPTPLRKGRRKGTS
nr:ClpX C4-type zinc finger protein [Myxococcus sp. CA056]